jgi:hypothetical protein
VFRNKHLGKLRTIFVCAFLHVGVLAGVPMRPEQIRELMQQMNAPTITHVLPAEDESGEPPRPTADRGGKVITKIAKVTKPAKNKKNNWYSW